MFNVQTIYAEHGVENYQTGREVLARFPQAKVIRVRSHWQIPELAGDEANVEIWNKVKSEVIVLGVKKGLDCRPNGRSTDFIAPSMSNGCASSCTYCVQEGTLISTPTGQVPVEQILDGSEVLAFDSSSGQLVSARVHRAASKVVQEVLEIQVGSRVLRVTAEHPILTRRGWVEAGYLTENDEVLCDETYRG